MTWTQESNFRRRHLFCSCFEATDITLAIVLLLLLLSLSAYTFPYSNHYTDALALCSLLGHAHKRTPQRRQRTKIDNRVISLSFIHAFVVVVVSLSRNEPFDKVCVLCIIWWYIQATWPKRMVHCTEIICCLSRFGYFLCNIMKINEHFNGKVQMIFSNHENEKPQQMRFVFRFGCAFRSNSKTIRCDSLRLIVE